MKTLRELIGQFADNETPPKTRDINLIRHRFPEMNEVLEAFEEFVESAQLISDSKQVPVVRMAAPREAWDKLQAARKLLKKRVD